MGKNNVDLSIRGMRKKGLVVGTKMKKTIVIEIDEVKYIPKYKRWAKDKFRMSVHLPDNLSVNVGDKVEIGETRKISKTKSWVVTKVLGEGE